ncbi:MAG: cytochrome P450 [Gemmatimonadota bacterium]
MVGNPFAGDCLPTRVHLFAFGRPSLPFPHPWNYREPIRILDTFFWGTERETGSGKHNRYLEVRGMPHVLVTREPAIIRAVLSATGDKPGQFDRDTAPTAGIARATGEDSLLYANGPLWRRQKQLAAPSFSRSNLFQPEKFHEFEQTFRKTVAQRLELLRARQQAAGQRVTRIELEPEIVAVMLEMLVNNFFGGNVSYEELRDRFVPALSHSIDHMIRDTVGRRLRAPLDIVTGRKKAAERARADFETLTDIALAGRVRGLGLWAEFKSDASDDALRSNIRVFLAGALEATTSFASWALSHLSRAPEVQERVYDEVKSVDVYDPENLGQAVTLNRVLEETLRITPSLYFLPRWTTVDTWIETVDGRKLFIPEKTHVVLDVWHANRCEDFWGKALTGYPAETFAPDRWEVLARQGRSAKDILHFGFGYGPRVCPGKYLGLLEVGLVVGAFVKIFRFTAVNAETRAKAGVSTKPADAALVDLELR